MNENFCVVLLMFPPSSMRRLIFFLPFCIARISDEVCDRYRTTSLNSALISSHCDDIGLCHGLGVTCITAFYSLINLQKRKIEIAPIIDEISSAEQLNNRRIEAQLRAGPTIEDDLRAYSSDLAGLFWLVDSLTERIMDSFPYILYDAESDQNLLRDVIKEAEEVSCEIDRTEDPHEFRLAIHESEWFVKWTWTVRLMFNHLTFSGKTIVETGALFFAFAPFCMHICMQVLY